MSPTNLDRIFIVGLTGGVAAGKSATAQRFAALQVPVFDADIAAREVVASGQPALAEIIETFGTTVTTAQGELDRTRMRELVFGNADARHKLEAILHPRIRARLIDQVSACTAPWCIVAVPLLVEAADDYRWVHRILITDVPREVQMQRLVKRPEIDAVMAANIIAAQAPRAQRLSAADDVIDNTGPLTALDNAVARLHQRYGLSARAEG
ncbi:MAG TPA: dephospho-CoA kinase [Rudaea sp.]|nr:dephospho-CoA kinase [Rudaea sp.]